MRNIIATIRKWNHYLFEKKISEWPGEWILIKHPDELTVDRILQIKPRYIFFPHWSEKIDKEILELSTCVCFHETDVPYGRGGSPVQNLIIRGHRETVVSALQMTTKLDEGPVFLKRNVSLEGIGEEIFLRISEVVSDMIYYIAKNNPKPVPQKGKVIVFKRRIPSQSSVPKDIDNLNNLFDFLRMLDADGYPKGFLDYGPFRFEFSRPALRTGKIVVDTTITLQNAKEVVDGVS